MKFLIVEDDFTSRLTLQGMLAPFGECDVAVNGEEAVLAFHTAHGEGQPYDVVWLDIMMPGMDGHGVLSELRRTEAALDLAGLRGVKVVMTTALDDYETIMKSFRGQCEAYLVKPIEKAAVVKVLQDLKLL